MEHLKNYWWIYLLLAIGIYWFFFVSFFGPSVYEEWKRRNTIVGGHKNGSFCMKDEKQGIWQDGECQIARQPIDPTL